MTMREQKRIIKELCAQMGGASTLALTLGVTVATIWRWSNGATKLKGTALVAIEAVYKRPEEYATEIGKINRQGRPQKKL